MEKRELELPLELILKIASGRDSDGIPRSASAIGIEKVLNEKETETVTDLFMEDAVTNIYQSGGAAVLTFDFKYNALGIYRKCKQLCEEWLKEQTEGCQFSTTVAPYTLTGQIILIFTQLMFTDGYEYKNEQNQPVYRLILGFDHTATIVLETNQIDYAQIQYEITEDLKRYEEEIDEQLAKAADEQEKLQQQENQMNLDLQQRLNNPLEEIPDNAEEFYTNDKQIRFTEEDSNIRFTNDQE